MSISFSKAAICFIACHGGPADHFATFAENLKDTANIEISASGPALEKFEKRGIQVKNSFSVENLTPDEEDVLAEKIAKTCAACLVVITDLGHSFDIKLQKALKDFAPNVCRVTYYDNPESFVPGGYSKTAVQVMLAAKKVLFANSNLPKIPIFYEPGKEINFENIEKIGIGYYPLELAEKIAKRRFEEQDFMRQKLFLKHNFPETGQKVFVYIGGNNEEYFNNAFPAFLSILTETMADQDFSNTIFVLQQHPGAKGKNLDVKLLSEWKSNYENEENAPKIIISDFSTDDVQVLADGVFYYQTSMGPQIVLAGIPIVQIGHESYQDILVRNHLAPSVTNPQQFKISIKELSHPQKEVHREQILESLGIKKDWLQILKASLVVNHE